MTLGPFSFVYPMVLWLALALPIIWWVIRSLPPKPKEMLFPPLILLKRLNAGDPPPDKSPWWILLLRLMLAMLVLLALSQPIYNPAKPLPGRGPIVVLVDNGWQSASRWNDWQQSLATLMDKIAREERPVYLIPTAQSYAEAHLPTASEPTPELASSIKATLGNLTPEAWSPNYQHVAQQLAMIDIRDKHVIWFSTGLASNDPTPLKAALDHAESVEVKTESLTQYPVAIREVRYEGLDITLSLVRPKRDFAIAVTVNSYGRDGRLLDETMAQFEADKAITSVTLNLPAAQRNDLGSIRLAHQESAGSVYHLDGRSQRPLTGVITGDNLVNLPPLKTARHYLIRALENRTSTIEGDLETLLANDARLIMMANIGRLDVGQVDQLERWIREGGVLVRFAGDRMENGTDGLIPVRLRLGNRSFGGTLTWDNPKPLTAFPENSPFYGLPINPEISVRRQILAAPDISLAQHTWASLEDGTPLVTGRQMGNGWIVLFHTSANLDWSNLAASGTFIDMLDRLIPMASGVKASDLVEKGSALVMQQMLTGNGDMVPAPVGMPALSLDERAAKIASLDQPAGLYGLGAQRVALNLTSDQGPITPTFQFKAANFSGLTVSAGLGIAVEQDLKPSLFTLATLLLIVDMIAALWLRGLLTAKALQGARAIIMITLLLTSLTLFDTPMVRAQQIIPPPPDVRFNVPSLNSGFVRSSTAQMRLAYIPTGNPQLDHQVVSGLNGLSMVMRVRTSVTLGPAFPIDPDRDTINLYPLIYWPITDNSKALSDEGIRKVNEYLQSGGMIFFDLGVGDPAVGSNIGLRNPAREKALQRITDKINIPPLVQVDNKHVLSKSYYLLERFPGRVDGRDVWVEKSSKGENPQVSSIVIGSHDWAAAWSLDPETIRTMPSLSGGEQQKELALRFGINLVMYALTGTYKNDTIHLSTIINRLRN